MNQLDLVAEEIASESVRRISRGIALGTPNIHNIIAETVTYVMQERNIFAVSAALERRHQEAS